MSSLSDLFVYNFPMRYLTGIALLILLLLTACAPAAEVPTAAPTTAPATQPSPTPTPEHPEPTLEPTAVPALDAQTTFEVVAAVHAYVLMLDDWADQSTTLFERQAMLQPVIEIGMAPLGGILADYTPEPALAASWAVAADLHADLYPQALDWVTGNLADQAFIESLAEIRETSRQMIEGAVLAAGPLGVDTAQYGPGYAGAVEVVFTLQPAEASPTAEAFVLPDAGPLEEAPGLQAVEVRPFLYSFAGSEIFLVIGLVEHSGVQPMQGVEVEVRFYNFQDEHLGTSRGRLLAGTANPGETYPFSASTVTEGEEAALKDWTRYEVTVYARPVEAESYQDFELVSSAIAPDSSGRFVIEGQLTNTGDRVVQAGEISVGVMAIGSEGDLVGVGEGVALAAGPDLTGDTLAPGGTLNFQIVIEAVSAAPAEFRFFAEVVE